MSDMSICDRKIKIIEIKKSLMCHVLSNKHTCRVDLGNAATWMADINSETLNFAGFYFSVRLPQYVCLLSVFYKLGTECKRAKVPLHRLYRRAKQLGVLASFL